MAAETLQSPRQLQGKEGSVQSKFFLSAAVPGWVIVCQFGRALAFAHLWIPPLPLAGAGGLASMHGTSLFSWHLFQLSSAGGFVPVLQAR